MLTSHLSSKIAAQIVLIAVSTALINGVYLSIRSIVFNFTFRVMLETITILVIMKLSNLYQSAVTSTLQLNDLGDKYVYRIASVLSIAILTTLSTTKSDLAHSIAIISFVISILQFPVLKITRLASSIEMLSVPNCHCLGKTVCLLIATILMIGVGTHELMSNLRMILNFSYTCLNEQAPRFSKVAAASCNSMLNYVTIRLLVFHFHCHLNKSAAIICYCRVGDLLT